MYININQSTILKINYLKTYNTIFFLYSYKINIKIPIRYKIMLIIKLIFRETRYFFSKIKKK